MKLILKVFYTLSFILFVFYSFGNKSSDKETEEYVGTLVTPLFSIGSFFETPDSIVKKMELFLDTISNLKNKTKEEIEFLNSYNLLKNKKLLYRPFFVLKLKSYENCNVYLNKKEFSKVKPYLGYNKGRQKNITIRVKGVKLSNQIIDCTKGEIISIEEFKE